MKVRLERFYSRCLIVVLGATVAYGCGKVSSGTADARINTVDATMCGNDVIDTEAGETCDDGGESAACDDDCTAADCGDSLVNQTAGEICDDGGESAACDDDCTVAECGDTTVNATLGETCDSGGVNTADCDSDCTAVTCGDGICNHAAEESIGERCCTADCEFCAMQQ